MLQKLQHLELMNDAAAAPSQSNKSWTLPSAILPGTVLAALTVLTFLHMPVADSSSLAHISSCTALQVRGQGVAGFEVCYFEYIFLCIYLAM